MAIHMVPDFVTFGLNRKLLSHILDGIGGIDGYLT
jgi:hypothetical protein